MKFFNNKIVLLVVIVCVLLVSMVNVKIFDKILVDVFVVLLLEL